MMVTLRDISQSIAAHIEPKIYPHITQETIEDKKCIKISFQGREAPYFAYGRAYIRVADEDRQLSAKELENIFLSKNRDKFSWEKVSSNLGPTDIDKSKLKSFITRAGLSWDSVTNVLEKLSLLKDKKILNDGVLFFAKHHALMLRCAFFSGTTSSMIIDRHDFEGDILHLIEEAQKYILKNINIGMRINGLERQDVPEISLEAMREAIINAFCHRDYHDPDHIHIAIFKNRVEIRNP